ncbi:Heme-binding protein A [Usitatibacter rugosus]|uniref:Heme-binding protein A n=1 Tax=Usitatibacter rugosus TaxID=2732067 RepID=A0A6M4GSA5_9PROT|nr:ABC transporter substrate-binding protein [Usitatibacter rugosus]QJR10189.1 Heme-binding protein A [Usitatibacter rugosus]
MKRRELIVSTGAALAALGLKELLGPLDALAQGAPKRGGKFVYTNLYPNNRMGDAKTGRHPYYLLDINTRSAFNGLAYVNAKLEVEPELATSWEPDKDLKVWDIQLREGVKFHNGRDMTADDVIASFLFHQEKTSFAKQIVRIEKTGPFKVRMHLDAPNSEFPYILGEYQLMVMPAEPIATIGLSGIGTGPFKIVELDPKRRLIMERHEAYWRKGMPYVDRLEVVSTPGKMEGALNGFRGGLFDAVLGVDPGLLPDLERIPGTKIDFSEAGDQALMILPKHEGSIFNDKRIRQALSLAIDRDKVMKIVYGAKTGWIGNDSHLTPANDAFVPFPKRDVAKAKKLLAEAGYPNGITLPTFYFTASWPEIPRVFQVVAQTVKEAGITLPIEQRPADGYRDWRVENKEKTTKHKFAYGPSGVRNAGVSLYRMRPDNNESGYWSGPACEEYMKLYAFAVAERDPKQRLLIYRKMQLILLEDVPAVHPVGRKNMLIHKPGVRGLGNHSQFWSIRFDEVWKA